MRVGLEGAATVMREWYPGNNFGLCDHVSRPAECFGWIRCLLRPRVSTKHDCTGVRRRSASIVSCAVDRVFTHPPRACGDCRLSRVGGTGVVVYMMRACLESRFVCQEGCVHSRRIALKTVAWLLPMLTCCLAGSAKDKDLVEFERRIRPLLIKHCGDCHGVDEPEQRLTLTTVAGIVAGGKSGPVLVPGRPDESRMIQAVRYTSQVKMPPEKRLSNDEIALLVKWIRGGAVLPGVRVAPRPARSGNKPTITAADRAWWAFQPVQKTVPPEVERADRVQTAVDRFVLQKLEARGLSLSPEADRRTLIRRLAFDLVGLPPSPNDVDAFVNDPRPDAYERLVERLLSSPHYGERWGRHWLDIARYADTNGGGFDYVYPHAWRYRDYVVQAFNQDKPYDVFVREQLAGDLINGQAAMLPAEQSALASATADAAQVQRLGATGFLTLAPKGLGMQDKEQMLLDVVDDQLDVLGRSLLGLTLACARCHDHKFDPISTEDYYGLAGIFRSTISVSDTDKNPSYWPERALEPSSVTQARKAYKQQRTQNQQAVDKLKQAANTALLQQARGRLAEYLFAASRVHRSRDRTEAVAHWPFDGPPGAVVNATAGPAGRLSNVVDGARQPVPLRTTGRLAGGLRFQGKQDVVAISPSELARFDFGKTVDFSLSFWLRAAEGYSPKTADTLLSVTYPDAMWFVALRPGGFHGVYLRHYDGKRAVDVKPSADQLPKLTDRNWHHLVFTSDRVGLGRVFLDGQNVGQVPISNVSKAADFRGAQSLLIGASTNQFQGDLDDVAIWNRVLSVAEIAQIHRSGSRVDKPMNVAQVQTAQARQRQATPGGDDPYTYQRAAADGLLSGVVRRLTGLLSQAEEDLKSPLRPLVVNPPQTLKSVAEFVGRDNQPLTEILKDAKRTPFVAGPEAEKFYPADVRQELERLAMRAAAIGKRRVAEPVMAMIAYDAPKPADLKVHIAGDHKNLGDLAPRGMPRIIAGRSGKPIPPTQSGRLQLAEWLTDPEHPLTARVLVNRVWQWHFGQGLVRTPDNFGQLGDRPSHPLLLDWLASELMREDWSIKQLQRRILLSATYRQSSTRREPGSFVNTGQPAAGSIDSGNRLLWRMNIRRLEAESLRDALLSVAGQLNVTMGGTVNDWKAKMFSVDDANNETANYQTHRRSIYLPVVRGASLHEMMQLFDMGDPNSITARRGVTTVAPQALFMMNSPFVAEQAKALAVLARSDSGTDPQKWVQHTYRLALSREPTAAELERSLVLLGPAPTAEQLLLLCQAVLCLNEFCYVE